LLWTLRIQSNGVRVEHPLVVWSFAPDNKREEQTSPTENKFSFGDVAHPTPLSSRILNIHHENNSTQTSKFFKNFLLPQKFVCNEKDFKTTPFFLKNKQNFLEKLDKI